QVNILMAPSEPGVAAPTILRKKAGLLSTNTTSQNPRAQSKTGIVTASQSCMYSLTGCVACPRIMRLRNDQLSPRYALSMIAGATSFAKKIHRPSEMTTRTNHRRIRLFVKTSIFVGSLVFSREWFRDGSLQKRQYSTQFRN